MKNFTSTKKNFTTLLAFLFLLASSEGQIINNNINYILYSKQYFSSADNDGATDDDITVRLATYSSSFNEWSDWTCHHWQCQAPCHNYDQQWLSWIENASYHESIDVAFEGWEEDGSSPCTYNSGDDFYNSGYASQSSLNNENITYGRLPSTCYSNFGEPTEGWLFYGDYNFDVKISSIWRFNSGASFDDPLIFTYLLPDQQRSNFNSNRSEDQNNCWPGWGSSLFYYNNNDSANPSPNVYYQFTTLYRSTVTVSTIHDNTDFDTFIQLKDNTGTLIEANDDYGGTSQSSVTQDLCAGTYYVMVEGYSSNEGNFVLTISAADFADNPITNVQIMDTECQSNNGSISLTVGNGVEPFHFDWSNGWTTNTIFDLSPGDYTVTVNDDCFENPYVATYTVASIDNENPVITSCPDYTVYLQPNETFDANNIWIDYDDNCGVVSTDFSPNSFTYDDIGDHQITFTALDELGNIGTCNFTLSIKDGFVSATKDLAEAISLSLYPNPASTSIHIDYTHSSSEPWFLEIYDTTGKRITQMATEGNINITVTDWPEGLYFYRLIDENNTLKMTERFVVVH